MERRWTGARCEIFRWNVGGQASDERYPGGTSADRIPDMRYPSGMRGSRPGGMRDSRPGGMRNFRQGEMSDATCRKGSDPQWVVVQAVEGSSGQLHDHLVGSKI